MRAFHTNQSTHLIFLPVFPNSICACFFPLRLDRYSTAGFAILTSGYLSLLVIEMCSACNMTPIQPEYVFSSYFSRGSHIISLQFRVVNVVWMVCIAHGFTSSVNGSRVIIFFDLFFYDL